MSYSLNRNRRYRQSALVAATFLGLASAGIAGAAEVPLTLAEAQRRALARSSLLEARQSAVTVAREQAVAAGELPDPVLKLGIDNLPIEGGDAFSLTRDFMTMRRIGVMQEWTHADKRDARRSRFEREGERAQSEQTATAAGIERDVALAWIDRYYAEADLAVVGDQAAEAQREIEAAEAAFRGGRGSAADLLAAQGAAVTLDDRAAEARRAVATAAAMLERWVGPTGAAPLLGDPPYDKLPFDAERLTRDPDTLHPTLEQLPAIRTLGLDADVAAAEVRVAQANRDPDWTFEVAYQQRGPAYSNMMSIGVSVPLPWNRAQRQDREVAAKLARVEEARALRADAVRMYAARLRTWFIEWQTGRERIALHDHKLVPLAKDRTRIAIAAYRGGKGSLADVLAARRAELDIRRSLLAVEQETARAWAQLSFLGTTPDAGASAAAPVASERRGVKP